MTMTFPARLPVFDTTMLYKTVSPTVALLVLAVLIAVIFGWVTGVMTSLEDDEPEKVPDVKLTEDWLMICGVGIVIFTSKSR